jgi:hypothetical protein
VKKRLLVFLLFIVMGAVSCAELNMTARPHHHGPPVFVIDAEPSLIVISDTYAYFVAGIEVDILFRSGHWYRPHNGRWYRGGHYNGPWVHVERGDVPGVFRNLPPGYRKVPRGRRRIPYGQLNRNWRGWERDRHWDKPRAKPRAKPNTRLKVKHKGRGKRNGKGRQGGFKRLWPF